MYRSSQDLGKDLLEWYYENKRSLPWRQTKDPYKIWLSEIILQQTQVKQGQAYYERFVKTFPDVSVLANSDINLVLKLWEGLGYYSRARNLHKAANQVLIDFEGVFPKNYNDLLRLKGVGPYTAAAISSIAYGDKQVVVDGNVIRYMSRLHAIEAPKNSTRSNILVKKAALDQLGALPPGDFNQAMMEFGALHCKVHNPLCMECFASNQCESYLLNKVQDFPRKKKALIKRERFFNYVIVHFHGKIAIAQRTKKDIWQGLNEFLLLEKNAKSSVAELEMSLIQKWNLSEKIKLIQDWEIQTLSHQKIYSRFFIVKINASLLDDFKMYNFVSIKDLRKYAYPKSILRFLEKNKLHLK